MIHDDKIDVFEEIDINKTIFLFSDKRFRF